MINLIWLSEAQMRKDERAFLEADYEQLHKNLHLPML